jgi:hypothetical protein
MSMAYVKFNSSKWGIYSIASRSIEPELKLKLLSLGRFYINSTVNGGYDKLSKFISNSLIFRRSDRSCLSLLFNEVYWI